MTPAKKDPEDRKSVFLKIRVTADRLDRWKAAALAAKEFEDSEDLDFSAWVRRALNQAERAEAKTRDKAASK